MTRQRILLAVAAALVLAVGVAVAVALLGRETPPRKRGSAKVEFDPRQKPAPKPAPQRRAVDLAWPTFGFDTARSKLSPYPHRPPYRRTWRLDARDTLEFPPSAAYGNVYLAQQKGLFFALNGKTGRRVFKTKRFRRCAASSPTIAGGMIYQSYMDFVPCPQGASNPTGFVTAMNARTGRTKWRFRGKPFESSPLLVKGVLYVGSWDGNVYAIRARDGRKLWSHGTGDRVNTSAAYAGGRIFIANDSGTLYALNARTGRLAWSASQATEFFYATPVAAYGRVYIGSTDGTMYAYGQRSGRLLWARPLGTYVYSSAAVAARRVFAGTYDGKLYSLDAATGDVRWVRTLAAAVHAPPVVMGGLVYAATCSSCGSEASRFVKRGRDGTTAFTIGSGRPVWHNAAGKYSSPIIADQDRVYLVGRSYLYGMQPKTRRRPARPRSRRR